MVSDESENGSAPFGCSYIIQEYDAHFPTQVLDGVTIDFAFLTLVDTGKMAMGCNCLSGAVIAQVALFFNHYLLGANLSSSLVHYVYEPCGTAAIMLSELGVSLSSGTGVEIGTTDVGYPDLLVYADYESVYVKSSIQMSASELATIIIYRYTTYYYSGSSQNISRYLFSTLLTNGLGFSAFLRNSVYQTFSPESGFSKSLARRESDYNDGLASSNIVELSSIPAGQSFWKRLLTAVFQVIAPASKVGFGLVRASGVSGGEYRGAMCSVSSENLIHYISSRIGIRSADIVPTNSENVKKKPTAKQTVRAITRVIGKA